MPQEEDAETDGSWCVLDKDGNIVCQILMLEVREDFGSGGGSNPMMQLLAHYAKSVLDKYESAVVQQTCYPALAIEAYGNNLRWECWMSTTQSIHTWS